MRRWGGSQRIGSSVGCGSDSGVVEINQNRSGFNSTVLWKDFAPHVHFPRVGCVVCPPFHFCFGLLPARVSVTAFPSCSVGAASTDKPQNKSLDTNAMTGGVCREVVMVLSHGVGQLLRSSQGGSTGLAASPRNCRLESSRHGLSSATTIRRMSRRNICSPRCRRDCGCNTTPAVAALSSSISRCFVSVWSSW